MPYIDNEARDNVEQRGPQSVGELTYAITSLIAVYLDDRYATDEGIHYSDLSEVTAALEEAKADFRQRIVEPYEAKKRNENGDVYGRLVVEYVGGDYAGYRP